MAKKILYALTILVAAWGLVYHPLQCIAAVKPFTQTHTFGEAMSALNFSPLIAITLTVAGWLIGGMVAGFREDPELKKAIGILLVWIISVLFGFVFTAETRDAYLDKQITWSGRCNMSEVFLTEEYPVGSTGIAVKLRCDDRDIAIRPTASILKDFAPGKEIYCTISVRGTPRCQ